MKVIALVVLWVCVIGGLSLFIVGFTLDKDYAQAGKALVIAAVVLFATALVLIIVAAFWWNAGKLNKAWVVSISLLLVILIIFIIIIFALEL